MAKSDSVLGLQGTFANMTFVHSRTYGKHIRAKRGTHKPADVNDSFKETSRYLIAANRPARMIKAALDPYCENFKCGQLWQRLVSIFRIQLKERGLTDLTALEGFEIHKEYPLARFMQIKTAATIDREHSKLRITLTYEAPPLFKKARYIDGYQLSVIVIYPDMKAGIASTAMAMSPVTELKSKIRELHFELPLPPGVDEYVLCLKLEGMEKDRVPGSMPTKGMMFVKRGVIS